MLGARLCIPWCDESLNTAFRADTRYWCDVWGNERFLCMQYELSNMWRDPSKGQVDFTRTFRWIDLRCVRLFQNNDIKEEREKDTMSSFTHLDHRPPSSTTSSSTDRLDERLHLSRIPSLIFFVYDQVIHELSNHRVLHRPHVGLSSLPDRKSVV